MITYQKNQQLGNFIFIREVDPYIRNNGYKRRRAVFICPHCKKEFKTRIENAKDKRGTSCGCIKNKLISKQKTIHGKTKTPLYFVWHNMKVRCLNKRNSHYQWYGKRGIIVCKEWKNNFQAF